jgi:hypothetical protein
VIQDLQATPEQKDHKVSRETLALQALEAPRDSRALLDRREPLVHKVPRGSKADKESLALLVRVGNKVSRVLVVRPEPKEPEETGDR